MDDKVGDVIDRNIKNLLTSKFAKAKKPNFAKSKKPNLTKSKKSKLVEIKKPDFAIVQTCKIDFLYSKAK